ncbi:histidinol-phosphate transaminase [Synechococcus sp. PCC 7502]|uniref:histidinol-phosphate transaminase n=1 Tax=Synechococcus sp. PCC 7502 TaxID=1173263 RepID=UPI000300C599|nr:histidinol-phosphate transaminase [Synechococcus sp. PCC 7502]
MPSPIRPDLAALSSYQAEEYLSLDHPIDKLDANEVSVDLPDWFKQKLGAIAQSEILANRYPDGSYLNLKKLIAEYTGVQPDQISLGNGSDELIRSLLIATCLSSDSKHGSILTLEPTFSMYGILAQGLGIPVIKVPRHHNDFSIDIEAANIAILSGTIKVVCLVHPNSPTGNLLNAQELAWVRSLPEHILVVIDEAYFEFSGHSLVPELAQHPNWLILRTFSKAFRLAAYRVGYAIANVELVTALEKIRLPYNLPTISQLAAELAMGHRHELLSNIPEICQERDFLFTQIKNLGISVWKSDANFLYLRTPKDSEILSSLKTKGTLIRQTGGGLRLTIGTPNQNQRTLERLKESINYF